jgi:integrase
VVRGELTNLKTKKSPRDVDMLPHVEEALQRQKQLAGTWVFPNAEGGWLDLINLRRRVWYPASQRAAIRTRVLYQGRHTFASLALYAGEDPAWVARTLGHSSLQTLYQSYAKWIRNRPRQDGSLYVQHLRRVPGSAPEDCVNH